MGNWLALFPGIFCVLAMLAIPGCLVLLACGISRTKTFLGAPLVSFVVIGIATLLTSWTLWGVHLVIFVTFAICALAIIARAILCKTFSASSFKAQWRNLKEAMARIETARICWLVASVASAAIASFAIVASAVPSAELFDQYYDAAFHLSVIRHIVETGCASPFGAGSVMGTAGAFYPDAFHALAALSSTTLGTSVPQSAWIVQLTLLMFVLPCSACLLACSLFDLRKGFSFLFAAAVPVITSASATSFAIFGPLYANLSGLAILPAAIAYVTLAFSSRPSSRRATTIAAALLASALGLGFTHPNTLFTLTLFLLPLFLARCSKLWQRLGLGALFVACWAACLNMSLFSRTVNCMDRIGEDVERGMALVQRFGISYDSLAALDWLPLTMSAAIIGAGIVLAVVFSKRWGNSWYLAALSLLAAQVACTLFPTNWFSGFATGFWYRDFFRLYIMLRVFALIALAAMPELALAHAMNSKRTGGRFCKRSGALGLTCAAILFAMAATGARGNYTDWREATVVSEADGPAALTQQRASFCESVASLTGGAVVLNNHNDASVWLYPVYGVNALAKGRPANQMEAMDEDYRLLITSIDRYASSSSDGEAVRQAVERLNVEYLVQMNLTPDTVVEFDEDSAISYSDQNAEKRVTESTPGFELLLDQDGMRLWKLV